MTPQTKLPARTRTLLVRHVVYLPYIFRSLFTLVPIIGTPGADNRNVPIIGNLRYCVIHKKILVIEEGSGKQLYDF